MDAIASRPADESLRTGAFAVLEGMIDSPAFAQAQILHRAAEGSPSGRRFLLEFEDRQRQALREGLGRRLGPDADPVFVAALAAAACGVLCAVTDLAVEATDDPDRASELHKQWVRRGLEHLFAGFDTGPTSAPEES